MVIHLSYATNWVADEDDKASIEDALGSDIPERAIDEEIIGKVDEIVMNDRKVN